MQNHRASQQYLINAVTATVMVVTALMVAWGLVYFSYQNIFAGFNLDDAFYLLMADLFSPFHPDKSPLLLEMVSRRNYPPLYPLYLSLFHGGAENIGNAQIANAVALIGGLGTLYLWQRKLNFSAVTAFTATLTVALSPMVMHTFQSLWSEHLYTALALLAMLFATSSNNGSRKWIFCACCVALASLTRTIGVALIGAFVFYAIVHKPPRRTLTFTVAALPLILERALNHIFSVSGHSYIGELYSQIKTIFTFHWFAEQSITYFAAWTKTLTLGGGLLSSTIAIILLITAAAELVVRLRKKHLDALYVIAYLIVILLWPFPKQAYRFLLPIFPFLLTYIILFTSRLIAYASLKIDKKLARNMVAGVVFVVVAMPSFHHVATRLSEPAPPQLKPFAHTYIWMWADTVSDAILIAKARAGFIHDMKIIAETVPASECVYSELPTVVMLYAHRLAVPSPWATLKSIGHTRLACRYYYMVPIMLEPPLSRQELARFDADHRIIYTSPSPRDITGIERLGVFADLRRPPVSESIKPKPRR